MKIKNSSIKTHKVNRDANASLRAIKKLEKRAAQRKINILRAKSMRLARLDRNERIPSKNNTILPKINVGCSGWFYWHWRNKFYPSTLSPSEWFQYYCKNFKTVELNAPFYSWPTISTVKTWIKQINTPEFVYTVKVSEMITHIKKFVKTENLIKDFYFIASILNKFTGCFLFQLPPSYKYTPSRLKNILKQLDPKYRNVVEFRHQSWWNKDVFTQFKLNKIIFCSCSSPNLPNDLIQTTEEIYIRFHGTSKWYKHDYSDQELQAWIDKIALHKPKRIWAYFNNDYESFAIKNAKKFIRLLKKYNNHLH